MLDVDLNKGNFEWLMEELDVEVRNPECAQEPLNTVGFGVGEACGRDFGPYTSKSGMGCGSREGSGPANHQSALDDAHDVESGSAKPLASPDGAVAWNPGRQTPWPT